MATKHNDPCRDRAADDEPLFTLRARDSFAPNLVRQWAKTAGANGTPAAQVQEAMAIADEMYAYQARHGRKVPD